MEVHQYSQGQYQCSRPNIALKWGHHHPLSNLCVRTAVHVQTLYALQYRKLNDRRTLDNLEAENVVIVWKVFPDDEDQQIGEDIHIDTILSGGDSQRSPKMCRKCFYDTLQKKQTVQCC